MDECTDRSRAARDRRYLYIHNQMPDLPQAQHLAYMELSPVTREARRRLVEGRLEPPQRLWFAPHKPVEELYDTFEDRHCVHNLAHDPERAETLRRLREAVARWQDDCDDLGRRSERQLIDDGLIADSVRGYAQRAKVIRDELNPDGIYSPQLLPDRR
jgi:uncharacterized sulfatase